MKIKLMEDSITEEEINAVNECMRSGQYTQWDKVDEFEREVAKWNGSKYGVMVNSGSSANLLMVDILKKKFGLRSGDEVLVPAVTWPTTVFPLIQNDLVPVFCDVDKSFNICIDSMRRVLNEKTKAVFIVHLLGQSADITEIKHFCSENGLVMIEDCCESMGARHNGTKIGNFGVMGSFSFYFGHHMTTIEGGMIVTDDFETYDLLKSIRSHGWVKRTAREEKYQNLPNRNFIFDVTGYNLRSTDMNASIGLIQLKKLDQWIEIRKRNHQHFLKGIENIGLTSQKVNFSETSSFCLPVLFRSKGERDFVLRNLSAKGVETRPIVAGNLLKQPVFQAMQVKADQTPMADRIDEYGIYLPNNQYVTPEKVDFMIHCIRELLVELQNPFDGH